MPFADDPLRDVAIECHVRNFHSDGDAFRAPGRVNLIGEHTDTSEGFVMPAALELATISVISPRNDSTANIRSSNFGEQISLDVENLPSRPQGHWGDYPASVLWSLRRRGISFSGFDMTLAGNVPVGAGLSSSASVEVAVAIAVLAHAGIEMPKPEIAKTCQSGENDYVGARCGIMDQFISCCGAKDHALLLDCRSLDYELLPLPGNVRLVLCNSMVRHSLSGGSEYNERRAEVEEGVRILRKHRAEIRTLRDIGMEELDRYSHEMPENVLRRCRHVVTENRRVEQAADALRRQDFQRFGALMYEAHASMRDDYEASCAETDKLVELAAEQKGCYGARITGAGFGGCTVNLVAADDAPDFIDAMRDAYLRATGIRADIYLSRAADGAGRLGK